MKTRTFSALLAVLFFGSISFAQTAKDAGELTRLLNEFLAGASVNDARVHDRFWADDLIYTRSAGVRTNKAELMKGLRTAPPPKPDDPKTLYTAEDIQIHQYGEMAVVAFRLVGTTTREAANDVSKYLNTGTFVRRGGRWQAVAWQSTVLARGGDTRAEVLNINETLKRALAGADVATLSTMLDAGFIWTHGDGARQTREQLLDDLRSAKLKIPALSLGKTVVSIYGDTVILCADVNQGQSTRSETASYYTLTLVYRNGAWRAVAMHSSGAL